MFELLSVDRDYETARREFSVSVPPGFNFAYDVIDRRGREADKTAVIVVSEDGEEISELRYSDLSRRSNRFANGLMALGIEKGEYACLIAGRIPLWYDALFGCMKAGVVSLPGTTLLTGRDIAYRIEQSGASIVIVSPEHCDKVESIRAECPTLKHRIVLGAARPGWISAPDMCAEAADTVAQRVPVEATDPMMAYFTSGTTALPKMVPRDFAYGLAHAATGLFWMGLRKDDIHWTLTDTGWAKAAWGIIFPQFLIGVTVVLYEGAGFHPELLLRLIAKLKVTTFCAPPTIYRMLAQMNLEHFDLSSIRRSLSAGEPLNPEVIRFWERHTGTVIADGYGQTETINVIGNFPGEPIRHGSMGRPVPGCDMQVVDDDGQILPPDEIGHIAMRLTDPWPAGLFTGYVTEDGLDTGSFRNGWYLTGDTATRDADGYFWFVGRADDLINSAGYRISPFEVESALLEHPAVAESAVVAAPDPVRGQIVVAHVVLARGHLPSDELALEIQEFCKTNTAPYKYPRRIIFTDDLPKTVSGKIRRVELREEG